MWVVCAVTTGVLIWVTWLALRERFYSAVMAATGLLYLAILTAFGTDLVARGAAQPVAPAGRRFTSQAVPACRAVAPGGSFARIRWTAPGEYCAVPGLGAGVEQDVPDVETVRDTECGRRREPVQLLQVREVAVGPAPGIAVHPRVQVEGRGEHARGLDACPRRTVGRTLHRELEHGAARLVVECPVRGQAARSVGQHDVREGSRAPAAGIPSRRGRAPLPAPDAGSGRGSPRGRCRP